MVDIEDLHSKLKALVTGAEEEVEEEAEGDAQDEEDRIDTTGLSDEDESSSDEEDDVEDDVFL